MPEFLGRAAKVFVDTASVGGAGATWVSIGQQSGDSLNRAAESTDATHKDAAGWAKSLITRNTWTISVEVILNRADAAWAFLLGEWRAQRMIFAQIDASAIGGSKEEGQAIITSLSEEFPEADKVTGTLELQGNGQLTISP